MIAVVDRNAVSQTPPISFIFHLNTTLNISAKQARAVVNRQVITELGTGLSAGEAELIIDEEQIAWRVPILLSLPTLGTLGQVGMIKVDPQTSRILTTLEAREKITRYASILYNGATLQTE